MIVMRKAYKYLIIGGGMTADAAVKGIRELDEGGEIGIISAEADRPYLRPPLSKGLWTGDKSIDEIWCGTEREGVEFSLSRLALALEGDKREVIDDHGDTYSYDQLLIATGGKPRRLPFGGDNIIYYRSRRDYLRLRKLVDEKNNFSILGGGFIGAELAAALALNNKRVNMIFPEAAICARLLPIELARMLNRYYEDRGVTLLSGRKPSGITLEDHICGVHLENGHMFPSDGVVAGIGIEPNTELPVAAGFEVDDGIVVDQQLRTANPRIFAAGDVANFPSPQLGRRMRVEHEDNALEMGRAAGRNMAGAGENYEHLPFFYSDLFELGYEAVGETDPALDVFMDLKDPSQQGCIFYLRKERVRGIVFWNIFGKVAAGRALIASPGPHHPEQLRVWMQEQRSQ
jgi:3-phenylpropionate/trans-cinnamate dioxygenase ferredoxin reductase component